jgi:hypothetical protein
MASADGSSKQEPPSPNSKRAEELVLSATKVEIRGEMESRGKGVVFTDQEWMKRFGTALGLTRLVESEQVFGIGFQTAYFYRGGEQVLSVAPIVGKHHLRVYSQKAGADFIIDERNWEVFAGLIREKPVSAKLVRPTPPPLTAPEGLSPKP